MDSINPVQTGASLYEARICVPKLRDFTKAASLSNASEEVLSAVSVQISSQARELYNNSVKGK